MLIFMIRGHTYTLDIMKNVKKKSHKKYSKLTKKRGERERVRERERG